MRYDVVFSEITGRGYRYPNVPARIMEAQPFRDIRNKEEQTENESYSVMRSNSYDAKTGVSRGHSSPTLGVMPQTW